MESFEITEHKIPLTETPEFLVKSTKSKVANKHSMMLAIPSTGLVRYEWHLAMMSIVVPVVLNWDRRVRPLLYSGPVGYHVAEARNLLVMDFLNTADIEWLFFIDHDVLPHPFTYAFMLEHMREKKYPIVSGLYYTKGYPTSPLIFRGRGEGPYLDWTPGDIVKVDGVVMGMTIIHRSILEYMWKNSPERITIDGQVIREVFRSPRDFYLDPEAMEIGSYCGTEDLWFCECLMKQGVFEKTGWSHLKDDPYPFLTDTRINCKHIDGSGRMYPDYVLNVQHSEFSSNAKS